MSEYTIVWIREEFAYHYFHKSDILYRFLTDYQRNKDRKYLVKQYDYITKFFPVNTVMSRIKGYHEHSNILKEEENYLEISVAEHIISLHVYEKHIEFRCEMLQNAEILLFPALRIFYPYLFVVRNDIDNYGWISPVTKWRKQKLEQVLYSYR